MPPILALRRLTKTFPGVRALDEVSLEIEPGEVHALVGENGAGKSTLIKIVAGAYAPDSGEMTLCGRAFRPRAPAEAIARGVSTIYQERSWLPDRSVLYNILLGRERGRLGTLRLGAMREEARRVLHLLRADDLPLDLPARRLGAGQKQMVEIARALAREASLLIMDEPTSALNGQERQALFAVIADLKARGLSILYISHRLDEIFRLADRVSVLRDGRHVLTAPVADTDSDRLIAAMIGRAFDGVFPQKNADPGAPLLTVERLTRRGDFREVSFTLRRGEVLGITGLAGSGKEELARAIYGALRPDSGRALMGGRPLRFAPADSIRRGIAFIPEERKLEGIVGGLSVRRNISLPLLDRLATLGHVRRGAERALAREWVQRLDIKTPGIEQECRLLSGGNQQKVALARGLAPRAEVVILVHPTQEIDVGVKFELYRLVAELCRSEVGIILVSSDLPEIMGLCHRILVMRDGDLAAELPGNADSETILRYSLGSKTAASL